MKIKLILNILLAAMLIAGVSACSPIYDTNYSYVPPKTWRGKKCVNRCLRERSRCRSRCQSYNQSCRNNANLAAMPAYLSYVEDQRKQNLPIIRNVNDFADYANCNGSCGCVDTYQSCFTNCGGEVIANTQCVAFCKKQ